MSIRPKKTILENGLRVVTVPMKDNKTVSIVISVATGSDYESKEENGISHFLEHMAFNGTENYPTGKEVALALDGIGAQYNASTSREATKYYGTAHIRHFDRLFDVLSDMYLNPTFPEYEVEKERKVIVEEINMYKDDPQAVVWGKLNELMYKDQPAGRAILGLKKNVEEMTREKLLAYQKKHYVPQDTIVTIAGGITHRDAVQKVRDVFGDMPGGKKHTKKKTIEKQNKPQARVVYKKTDQTHIRIGIRAVRSHNEKDMWPLMAIRSILSGGMSGRLWQEVREERGLAYYIGADIQDYSDRGAFILSAGVGNKSVEEAIIAVLTEVEKMKENEVEQRELRKIRDAYASSLVLSKQTSSAYAHFYSTLETLKISLFTLPEMIRTFRKVTPRDIRRVAKKYFKNENLNMALIGPFKNARRFEKLLKL